MEKNAVCTFALVFLNAHNGMQCVCDMYACVWVITSLNSGMIIFLNLLIGQHVSFNFYSAHSLYFTALLYSLSSLDISSLSLFFSYCYIVFVI